MKIKIPLKRMPQPFIVRTACGAGSQLVALMAAIQVSSKIQRPFQILHFPYSTGAYYPFAIEGYFLDWGLARVITGNAGLYD